MACNTQTALSLLLIAATTLTCYVNAQDGSCSPTKPCPPNFCCSKWNFCGQGPLYCQGAPAPSGEAPAPISPPKGAPSPDYKSPPSRPGDGRIAAYWGQNGNEGPLVNVCHSGNYQIILISFLTTFGNFQPPMLNLAGHCDPYSHACTFLSDHIKACQAKGIKVLLSLGGGDSPGHLVNEADAKDLAKRLWNDFLGGKSSDFRPLGPAVLDGIDLDIESGSSPELYAALVRDLRQLGGGQDILVSAAPQCPFPDANLGSAVQTPGLFDYIFIQFYNNPPCAYGDGSSTDLITSWKQWTKAIPTASIFLGLPASPAAAGSGFLPPSVAKDSVLPAIKSSSNYGGVMLWSVYFDQQESYSEAIRSHV